MNLTEHDGTIGLPLPSTDVCLMNEQDGVGELAVKGPQVMQGYWQKPNESPIQDGWLLTGDLASIDEQGRLRIVDEKKTIIVNGFNVYPNEVEDVIMMLPEVNEVAVAGAPDDVKGEQVQAFVVLHPNKTITEEAVITHCRKALTGYKIPRKVNFLNSLQRHLWVKCFGGSLLVNY